jgi:protein phosphatase
MDASPVLTIPPRSLVVLVGAAGSGKSTFARRHFAETAVISSDRIRAWLADDEADQSVSAPAFEVLHLVARRRLEAGRVAVVDATSATAAARAQLVRIAREVGAPVVAVVLDAPLELCLANNARRAGRRVEEDVIRAQHDALTASLPGLRDEGFDAVFLLRGASEIEAAVVDTR